MKKILAVGCSITRGHGLAEESKDPRCWVNQVFQGIGEVHNVAMTGMNNHWIFMETMSTLLRTNYVYDIVLVAWTNIPRYNFHVGLELHKVNTMLTNNGDIGINPGQTVSGKWLQSVGDDLRRIHNDHWDILDLVKYVNALIMLYKTETDKKIFFVNALCPWSHGYFDYRKVLLPSELSQYEQNLLQAETRDDHETLALYEMIHTHYRTYGGIQPSHWLNLYQSLRSLQIDRVSDSDPHPGYQSQDVFAKHIGASLKQRLNCN